MMDTLYSCMMSRRCIFFLMVIFTLGHIYGQSCLHPDGRWINQDSSIMQLSVEAGMVTGQYLSIASDDTLAYALYGVYNAQGNIPVMSVHVSWGDRGSITSWTGYCQESSSGSEWTMLWHLVRPYVHYDWERIVTNQSVFKPLSQ